MARLPACVRRCAAAAAVLAIAAALAAPRSAAAAPVWPLPLNEVGGAACCVGVAGGGEVGSRPSTPNPNVQTFSGRALELDARRFRFASIGAASDVLAAAFERYDDVIFRTPAYAPVSGVAAADAASLASSPPLTRHASTITSLRVYVAQPDQSLNVHTDESYAMSLAAPTATVQATTVFGALRALETFAQLVDRVDKPMVPGEWGSEEEWSADEEAWGADANADADADASTPPLAHHHRRHRHRRKHLHGARFLAPAGSVWDEAAFPHRGTLVDSARHFLPVAVLVTHLDAMAASKMNVLHWHLTDDESFAVDLPGVPELAARGGAGGGAAVYSAADVAAVVAAARERGIRVIPEIDAPSHAASWGGAYPGALAECFDSRGSPRPGPAPLDPSAPGTTALLWRVLRGAAQLFPESKIHAGGDEVDLACWASNPAIVAWATAAGHKDMRAAFAAFAGRAVAYVNDLGRDAIVWQESFEAGATLPPRTEVEVWRWWSGAGRAAQGEPGGPGRARRGARRGSPDDPPDPAAWQATLRDVTAAGHRAILAAPWYLNLGERGAADWKSFYAVDPRAGLPPSTHPSLVIGGEACVWGERVGAANLAATAWPRAAAVGERLWSAGAPAAADADVEARLAVHACRLRARGVGAAPVAAGWCPADGVGGGGGGGAAAA